MDSEEELPDLNMLKEFLTTILDYYKMLLLNTSGIRKFPLLPGDLPITLWLSLTTIDPLEEVLWDGTDPNT